MRQLHPGGRLVMTFILMENLTTALAHLQQIGAQDIDCLQMQVSAWPAWQRPLFQTE
jgi:cobalt-precorrin-6B (C15)-methyltransferase